MRLYLIFLLRMVMGGHNYFDRKLYPWPGGKWVGTAPICDASAGDCPGNDAPYTHYGFENSGPDEGEACFIGAKSFCTSYKIWDDWSEEGTAPYCDADCSDCPDAYECIAEARYGDRGESQHVGDMCWQVPNWWGLTERKAFCGRPAKEQQYLGCFLVTSDDTSLSYGPYTTSAAGGYTIATCREKCKQYEFFALWQGQCSCDEYYSNVIEHGAIHSVFCFKSRVGGNPLSYPPAAMSVFRNYYRGCFSDVSNDRALRYGPYSGHTIDSCRDKCKSFYFFALQNGGYCFCESSFIHITKHGVSSACSSQGTGGYLANSVYENYWCSQAWSTPHASFCLFAFQQVLEYKQAASASTAIINDMVELIKKNDNDNKEIKTNNKIKFYLFVTITGAIFINVICLGYWCICKFKKRGKYHVTSTYDQESDESISAIE